MRRSETRYCSARSPAPPKRKASPFHSRDQSESTTFHATGPNRDPSSLLTRDFTRSSLLAWNTGLIDDIVPFFDVGVETIHQLSRRARLSDDADPGELFFHVRHGEDFAYGSVHGVDDLLGRILRDSDAVPGNNLVSLHPRLIDGWHVWQQRRRFRT